MSSGLPPLTDEEKAILFQTRKEAIYKRVIPVMAITNGFLYFRGRQTGSLQKATLGGKIALFGTTSIISFFVGVASYGSEFKRRLDELEYSPLRDAMNKRAGIVRPRDRIPMDPQLRQPSSPFTNPSSVPDLRGRDSYSYQNDNSFPFQTDSHNQSYNNPYHDNLERDSFGNYRYSGGGDRDGSNVDYGIQSDSFTSPDKSNDTHTQDAQKFMSYKDRRNFYRNNPDAVGRIDPFENMPNRNKTSPSNIQPMYPPAANPSKDSQVLERPFIPFFNENSNERKESGSDGKFF